MCFSHVCQPGFILRTSYSIKQKSHATLGVFCSALADWFYPFPLELFHWSSTRHIRTCLSEAGPVSISRPSYLRMAISMLKIRRPLGRLIFNMGIAIPGKTVFLIETAPRYQGQEKLLHPYLWFVITYPCPWHLLLPHRSTYKPLM